MSTKYASAKTVAQKFTAVYIALALIGLLLLALAVIGIILGAIALKNSNDLSSNKIDISDFTDWTQVNCTLYKNFFTDNIVLLEDVPIKWIQVGFIVWVRLPFITVTDTLAGTTQFFDLHILNANRLPVIVGDVHDWGSSSSVFVGALIYNVNSNVNNRVGDINAFEFSGTDGQSFIYDLDAAQAGDVLANSVVVYRGGLIMYETNSTDTVSSTNINTHTTQQILSSATHGGLLPSLPK